MAAEGKSSAPALDRRELLQSAGLLAASALLEAQTPPVSLHTGDVHSDAPLRYGVYLCLTLPPQRAWERAGGELEGWLARNGFRNEFLGADPKVGPGYALLRFVQATAAQIADDGLLRAGAVLHASSATEAPVSALCEAAPGLLGADVGIRALRGVARPTAFTGNAMHNFAYAHRVNPQPGAAMPHAFLLPMSKSAEWWRKSWMERHTYILPRFDDSGKMTHEGHALLAEPGVAALMRRTYKHPTEPAPDGAYDFLTYFECADTGVPVFHQVCAALRNTARNPEWNYVREGPLWHGRRVAEWAELRG